MRYTLPLSYSSAERGSDADHRAVPVRGSMSRIPWRIALRHAIRRIVFQYLSSIAGSSRNAPSGVTPAGGGTRSEEHTSELQSQSNLVCRLLLEKKKKHL